MFICVQKKAERKLSVRVLILLLSVLLEGRLLHSNMPLEEKERQRVDEASISITNS